MNERWQKYRIYIISGIIIICLFVFSQKQDQTPEEVKPEAIHYSESMVTGESTATTEMTMDTQNKGGYVDVKGEVKRPGMYAFETNSRIYDCIQKAGGLTKEADDHKIDYAQKVTDQMTIIIPKKGSSQKEIIRKPKENSEILSSTSPLSSSNTQGKININTATKEQLQTISGIGEKRAQDIITYREQHGSFKQVDELDQISGIGEKTLAKLKEEVCL